MATSLTLNEALRTHRLNDFIAQAEADGVEPADAEAIDPSYAQTHIPFTRSRWFARKVNSSR